MSDEAASSDATVDSLRERVASLREDLEAAETEADLDDVEADLASLREDIEAADLPEPDEEDEADPAEELASDVDDVEADLEDARGPYAEDVVAGIEDARDEIDDTRWTEQGEADLAGAVDSFVDDVDEALDASVPTSGDGDVDQLTATLDDVATAVGEAGLDPDDDAGTIAALLEAVDALRSGIDDAQSWDDLSVRQRLRRQGYYDVTDHVKDFPPEWHALKVHEKRGNAEMVLLALEMFDSDFMEEHCLEALQRMAPVEAIEPMLQRAQKRDKQAITILGKIGSEEPVETLLDYVDADTDPLLQKVTFRALGEIGAEEAVQPIANKLVAENPDVRSQAARALGLIGDTRAIDPLADVLADDEEDVVRASAAWALNRIGTADALDALAEYADDRAYVVQAEAEKAA